MLWVEQRHWRDERRSAAFPGFAGIPCVILPRQPVDPGAYHAHPYRCTNHAADGVPNGVANAVAIPDAYPKPNRGAK